MRLPPEVLERFVASYFSQRERFLAAPSPAYLLDGQALRARALAFRRTFQELRHPCSFYFAVKSNNTPRVAAILLEEGFGLDVSGAPELEGALALGARDIIFSGPGKTAEELRLAAAHPEVTVLLDSFGELERLEGEAAARGRVVRAGVRLSPEAVSPWSKFGIPPEELPRFCREARSRPHVRLEGVQCHTSWNMSPRPQCRFLETIAGALENVDQKSREQLTFLDVGGGYWPERGEWLRDDAPSPDPLGHRLEPASPLAHYARDLSRTLGTHRSLRALGRLCFEPGRWICDDAMHLTFSVVDVKGPDIAIADIGVNAVGWERFEQDYCPVLNLSHPSLRERPGVILGSLCTPHDVLGFSYFGEGLHPGDRLLIPCQKTYTRSLAQAFIKAIPPVVELPPEEP